MSARSTTARSLYRLQSQLNHRSARLLPHRVSPDTLPIARLPHRYQRRASSLPPKVQPAVSLQSGLGLSVFGVATFIVAAGFLLWQVYPDHTLEKALEVSNRDTVLALSNVPAVRIYPGMAANIPPGRPGNLTTEQEAKLRELWEAIFNLTGSGPPKQSNAEANGRPQSPPSGQTTERPEDPGSSEKKKRRFGGLLGRKKDKDARDESDAQSEYSVSSAAGDKHGQTKEFKEALAKLSPMELREYLWQFSKADDPDANLCRYLRARKWNVHDALVMLISTIHWRSQVMRLDQDVMKNGEEAAVDASKGTPQSVMDKKMGDDFMAQLRMGKSFLHGTDKDGRPMCFVRVRLHRQGEQSEAALERYTVYTIETARFMLRPPVDTAVIVFDMTNFSLANMDYSPVKFMIKVFEANYPESLGHVLVHKSPWIFQSIWTIIRGWLDPVVASKVHFTKDAKDLSQYVDMKRVPKELGGEEDWEYQYQEPTPGENEAMNDEETRAELEKERAQIVEEYERATLEWVRGDVPGTAEDLEKRRLGLAQKLRENYWALDPFIRARSVYDRTGIIQEGGKIDMYPNDKTSRKDQQLDGTSAWEKNNGPKGGYGLLSSYSNKDADERSIKSVYYDAEEQLDVD